MAALAKGRLLSAGFVALGSTQHSQSIDRRPRRRHTVVVAREDASWNSYSIDEGRGGNASSRSSISCRVARPRCELRRDASIFCRSSSRSPAQATLQRYLKLAKFTGSPPQFVVWQFNEAQLQNGPDAVVEWAAQALSALPNGTHVYRSPCATRKMVRARRSMVAHPRLCSKNITSPKKVRQMNDIKACRAIKGPNLSSAESPPRLQFSVII